MQKVLEGETQRLTHLDHSSMLDEGIGISLKDVHKLLILLHYFSKNLEKVIKKQNH